MGVRFFITDWDRLRQLQDPDIEITPELRQWAAAVILALVRAQHVHGTYWNEPMVEIGE